METHFLNLALDWKLEHDLGDLSKQYLIVPIRTSAERERRQHLSFQIMLVICHVTSGQMLGLGKEICVSLCKFHMETRRNVKVLEEMCNSR